MKPVKIGVMGLGTVGAGTLDVLQNNRIEICRRAGREIQVIQASARDIKKPRSCDLSGIQLTTDPFDIVRNPDIDVVVELIGGESPACDLVLQAIEHGKHVVTANKALIAKHGNQIFAAAQDKKVVVAFEAAVAGGIPIIKALREGLTANHIEWLAGIINGTGNFILTEMRDKNRSFEEVLKEAQALGYAEADPTFDIEGIDAAHKLTILTSIAFGIPLQFDKVYTEGITHITLEDVAYAEQLGYRIKHIGFARKRSDGIEMRVHPTLIPEKRLIANVDGVMNAVLVKGDAVGPTLYYGPGAGAGPTASSVVADLVDVVRTLTTDPENRVPHLAFQPDALSDHPVLPIEACQTAYYLRIPVQDEAGVIASISRILAEQKINIESILQKEPEPGSNQVDVILLTQPVTEKQLLHALAQIGSLPQLAGDIIRIRLEGMNA
ncbi:MAG: homoserine dehydrogenase [Gammaproteobacteria bacterium]|nr:MAG: homoserine dehydrogenase [Gammaproteobacteria bacterium]